MVPRVVGNGVTTLHDSPHDIRVLSCVVSKHEKGCPRLMSFENIE